MAQLFTLNTWQKRLLISSLFCPFLILLLSRTELLNSLSQINYDELMRLRATKQLITPGVLLIETNGNKSWSASERSNTEELLKNSLGAKSVIFYGIEEFSNQEVLPKTESGVFRSYPIRIKNKKELAIEASLLKEKDSFFPDSVLIDFGYGLGGLPKTTLEALQRGELIEELVKDRYVLVGKNLDDETGLATPVSPKANMSLLEYRGHAFQTLLGKSWIRDFSIYSKAIILFFITLVSIPLYLRLTNKLATIVTLAILSCYFGLSAIAFVLFSISLPLIEMIFTQFLLFALITRSKSIEAFKVLERVQIQSEAKLEEHYWPKSLVGSADFFKELENLFTMVLPITNCFFYVRKEDSSLFELASTLEESSKEAISIIPKDFDFNSEGFKELLKVNKVIQISDLNVEQKNQSASLITPLQYAGQTVGLVVINPKDDTSVGAHSLKHSFRQLADEVAPLLQRRQNNNSLKFSGPRLALFSASPELKLYNEIADTFDESILRIDKLEDLLEGLGTAAIVYDFFGRVIFVNEHMRELTDDEELSLFDIEASQFISTLGQLSEEQTRSILRSVVFQNEQAYLPVRLKGREKSRFTMRIGPLELSHDNSNQNKQIEERGIVCEIADISAYSQLSELKGLLSQRLGLQIRNDLGVIEMGTSILGDANISPKERAGLLSSIQRKVDSITNTLADCEKYLAMDSEMQNREQYPVDSRSLLSKAINEVKELAHNRGIELKVTQPNVISYSVASSEGLEEVFISLLEVLIADSTDNGIVNTEIIETEGAIIHKLTNSGFGIPAERLKEYVFGNTPIATKEFQRLREAAEKVKNWGGVFEADSELGTGLRLSLKLPRFL